jgi:TPR repeat protein
MDWYGRSARAGFSRAQFNYGAMLAENGLVRQAAEWLWRAAEGGTPEIRQAVRGVLAGARDAALTAVRARADQLL